MKWEVEAKIETHTFFSGKEGFTIKVMPILAGNLTCRNYLSGTVTRPTKLKFSGSAAQHDSANETLLATTFRGEWNTKTLVHCALCAR